MKTSIIDHLTVGATAVPIQPLLNREFSLQTGSQENTSRCICCLWTYFRRLKDSAFHHLQSKLLHALTNIPNWLYDEMRKWQQG